MRILTGLQRVQLLHPAFFGVATMLHSPSVRLGLRHAFRHARTISPVGLE